VAQAVGDSLTPLVERLPTCRPVEALGKEIKRRSQTTRSASRKWCGRRPPPPLFAANPVGHRQQEAEIDGAAAWRKPAGRAACRRSRGHDQVPLINAFLDAAWRQQ